MPATPQRQRRNTATPPKPHALPVPRSFRSSSHLRTPAPQKSPRKEGGVLLAAPGEEALTGLARSSRRRKQPQPGSSRRAPGMHQVAEAASG